MTVKELRAITEQLPEDAEVVVLVGPDEDAESYVEACATLAASPERGRYLLVEQVW